MEEILISLIQGEDGKNWAKDKKGWKPSEHNGKVEFILKEIYN